MKRILFLIHDFGVGGAEKVLVNLVNNMDRTKFDITVMALFGGGVNEQFLKAEIKFQCCFKNSFPANTKILKLFSPKFLHKHFIKENYDIEVSYLEGPSARIISGCPDKDTKLVSWIHIQQETKETAAYSFRSYQEAKDCYDRFDQTICVSEYVKNDFQKLFELKNPIDVLYNTNETNRIMELAEEPIDTPISDGEIKLCVVGKLAKNKGCDRVLRIQKRFKEDHLNTHIYFLGVGSEEENMKAYIRENALEDSVTLLGYQTNPYKYVKKFDLFVCASFAEGFSTATTEALVLGVPVVTVEVSGMKEMLGANNEYGIVTENDENALYEGIRRMITTPGLLAQYAEKANERGKAFSTEKTVKAVEDMLESLS